MSKYIKYYESKFPENIKDLQDYNEWPFVGYNMAEDVAVFTSLQENDINSQPDNEIWYTTTDNQAIEITSVGGQSPISSTFSNNKGVVQVPNPITYIGSYLCRDTSTLSSISLPGSLQSITAYAFFNCSALTEIKYKGMITEWDAITKAKGWRGKCPACTVKCLDGDISLEVAGVIPNPF